MEIPTINPQDISKFHSLHDEFKKWFEEAGEAINLAKLNGDQEITISREGKLIVVPEKALWDEVWALGPDTPAGEVLKEKYPDAFNKSRKAEVVKGEMKAFAIQKWGIDPLAMSLSDIMRMMEAMVDYKLAQKA